MKAIRIVNTDNNIDLLLDIMNVKTIQNKDWDSTDIKQSISGYVFSFVGDNKGVNLIYLERLTQDTVNTLNQIYINQYVCETTIIDKINNTQDTYNSIIQVSNINYDNQTNLYKCSLTIYRVYE